MKIEKLKIFPYFSSYKPYVEIDLESSETLEEFYKRGEMVMHAAVRDTEAEGTSSSFSFKIILFKH